MIEVVKNGMPHLKVAQEAFVSGANHFSGIKRYERADLDRWFDGYDVCSPFTNNTPPSDSLNPS